MKRKSRSGGEEAADDEQKEAEEKMTLRIRYLQPDYFLDEDIAALPDKVQKFYQGLWVHADREGRLEDRPGRLKVEVMPYNPEFDAEEALSLLAQSKKGSGRPFIVRYQVDGERYIQIVAWKRHQKPHPSERASRIPPLPDNVSIHVRDSVSNVEDHSRDWDGDGNGNRDGDGDCNREGDGDREGGTGPPPPQRGASGSRNPDLLKRQFFNLLKSFPSYPFHPEEDQGVFDKFSGRIDIIEQTKRKITWWKENPAALKSKKKSSRQQLIEFLLEEVEFKKGNQS